MDEAAVRALRQELAAALKRLRLDAGLSTGGLARKRVGSQAKISRTENAIVRPTPATVRAWGAATGAKKVEIDHLAGIAEQLGAISRTWRSAFAGGMVAAQRRVGGYEAAAESVRAFSGAVVPGLLQVPGYAHAVLSLLPGADPREVDAAVTARMERQAILYREDKPVTVVVGELALRWLPESSSDDLWQRQVERMLLVADMPTVEVLVLPDRPGWPVLPAVAMTLCDVPDEPVAIVEDSEGEREVRDAEEYARHLAMFERVAAGALRGAAAETVLLNSLA